MLSIALVKKIKYCLKKARRRRRRGSHDKPDGPDDPSIGGDSDSPIFLRVGCGGEWWGTGAALLGLEGVVKEEHLKALFNGYGPYGRPLVQTAGRIHQPGWDLVFSLIKSGSVLWSQVPELRPIIEELHRQAVHTALNYATEVAIYTRRGKGGKILEHALPIVAIFPEGLSRELQPQIHSHSTLLNVAGRASDSTFGTILSKPFFQHKLTIGAVYQAEVAYLFRKVLGLRLEEDEVAFRIAGVPQELVEDYSKRSQQIREKLDSVGYHSAKAAAIAALDTRKAEPESPPSLDELLKGFEETNARRGFTTAKALRLLGQCAPPQDHPNLGPHIAEAMNELLKIQSHFSEQELIRETAREVMVQGVPALEIISQVRTFLRENPEIVPLESKGLEPLFSTRETIDLERKTLASIRKGRRSTRHVVDRQLARQIIDKELPLHPGLTDDERKRNVEQRKAAFQLTTRPGDVHVLEGWAGAGKTYVLNVCKKIWEKAGHHVTAMALSGVVAEKLQEDTGIESATIALRLLQLNRRADMRFHHKRQLKRLLTGKRTYAYRGREFRLTRNHVVLIDEAAMNGTRRLAELLRHIRSVGAKLVLVGDRRQLQPIEAGGLFPAVADITNKAELKHVVRQKEEPWDPNPTWHRQAGKLIAAGHTAQALKLFAERGRLSVLDDRRLAKLAIVRDWSVEGIANPIDHVILAGTREEVSSLNAMCQNARIAADAIGSVHVPIADCNFCVGDVVIFKKTSKTLQVRNGSRGTILSFNRLRGTIAVQLHAKKRTVIIPYRSYTDIVLGYASTTHAMQGATIPSVYVLLGGSLQDRHLSYVQTTRASESTRLYVDKYHAGQGNRDLIRDMERLREKVLALHLLPPKAEDEPPAGPVSSGPGPGKHSAAKSESPSKSHAGPPQPRREAVKSRNSTASDVLSPLPAKQRAGEASETRPGRTPGDSPTTTRITAEPSAKSQPTRSLEKQLDALQKHAADARKDSAQSKPPTPALQSTAQNDPPLQKHADQSEPVSSAKIAQTPSEASPPKPRHQVASRDIRDLSHVRITPTLDLQELRSAVSRYGRLPGGFVVEGFATTDVPVTSLTIDPSRPSSLIINGSLEFNTGLTTEELCLLWHAVLRIGHAAYDFGVLSQTQAIGIENDTVVATTMMAADNLLGAIVYGHDAQFSLRKEENPLRRNPFVDEMSSVHHDETEVVRLFANYLDDIYPQFFAKVKGAHFAATSQGLLLPTNTDVSVGLGVVKAGGSLAVSKTDRPVVENRFRTVHDALKEFLGNFAAHCRTLPDLCRSIAYAELVLLLRNAKLDNAKLSGQDYVQSVVENRRVYPLPRFNYTSRSKEFVEVSRKAAHHLSNTTSTSFMGLYSATVGLTCARGAGDDALFFKCKRHALKCIKELEAENWWGTSHYELSQRLPDLAERIRSSSHDLVLDNCLWTGCANELTKAEREGYLAQAIRLCGSSAALKSDPIARCRRIEADSYLDPDYQPLTELAKVRSDSPASMEPFCALARIANHRSRHSQAPRTDPDVTARLAERTTQLGIDTLPPDLAHEWLRVTEQLSNKEALSLLETIRRYELSATEFLESSCRDKKKSPRTLLLKLLTAKLRPLKMIAFSTHLLSSLNPFADCHELLELESPKNLERLLTEVRLWIDPYEMSKVQESKVQRFISALKPRNAAQWWYQYLKNPSTSKIALLLAHELKNRKMRVTDLYGAMRRHGTENPQAALFYCDLEKSQTEDCLSEISAQFRSPQFPPPIVTPKHKKF